MAKREYNGHPSYEHWNVPYGSLMTRDCIGGRES